MNAELTAVADAEPDSILAAEIAVFSEQAVGVSERRRLLSFTDIIQRSNTRPVVLCVAVSVPYCEWYNA
jgi:hypothetical protein